MIIETTKGSHTGSFASCWEWQQEYQGGYAALRVMYANGKEIYVDVEGCVTLEDALEAINAEGVGGWLGDEDAEELRAIWVAREARGALAADDGDDDDDDDDDDEEEEEDDDDDDDEEEEEDEEEDEEDAAYSLAQCHEAMAYAAYLAAGTGPKAPAAYAAFVAAEAATEAARIARRDARLRGAL